jgi:hypothetical protein
MRCEAIERRAKALVVHQDVQHFPTIDDLLAVTVGDMDGSLKGRKNARAEQD